MLAKIGSIVHGTTNEIAKNVLGEGLKYKHAIVRYHNTFAKVNLLVYGDAPEPLLDIDRHKYRDVFSCTEHYYQNSLYGIANVIKSYCGYEGPICACVEHGVYFGDFFAKKEVYDSGLPGLLTFSKTRADRIDKVSDIAVYPIGPYIQYAMPWLQDLEFETLKEKLGKTLLVFPSHSVKGTNVSFDLDYFAKMISSAKEKLGMDSAIVCLYYTDLEHGLGEYYIKRGFRVACAGHRKDPAFLPKLRSLIELSDYTMSNACGTHIGYCVSLGKPHTVIEQPLTLEKLSTKEKNENTSAARYFDIDEIVGAFSSFGSISNRQLELCDKYWGSSLVMRPHDLRILLEDLEKRFIEMGQR